LIIVADTSALYAGFDASQREHGDARAVMEEESLVISPLVLTDLDHLVHRDLGFDAAMQVADALIVRAAAGQYKLAELRHADLVTAHGVRAQYKDLHVDMADAVGVVLADRYNTDCIFTLDQRDYRALRPLTKRFRAFRVLPADGR
jgi:predicted nucleic acid-binding protein